MNKHLLITTFVLSATGVLFAGNRPPKAPKPKKEIDPTEFSGGVAAHLIKQASENIVIATIHIDSAAAKVDHGVTMLTDKLSDENIGKAGDKFGEKVVTSGLTAGCAFIGAKATVAAESAKTVAYVAGPWALGALYVGSVAAYCMNVERQKEYGRCLRTHFDCPSVDKHKMPRRCHSPKARAEWWSKEDTDRQTRIFKILKETKRRPRPPVPGSSYSNPKGPSILWEEDLKDNN